MTLTCAKAACLFSVFGAVVKCSAVFLTLSNFVFVSLVASAQASAQIPDEALLELNTPWSKDGERFQSYSFFRDELMHKILNARVRVALVTPLLADADLATALFSQRIKGLNTLVLLDQGKSRSYHSRHEYLARALVPTHLVRLDNLMGSLARENQKPVLGSSYVVLDNEAWAISTWFEEYLGQAKGSASTQKGGSGRDVFAEPARFTADEIWSWQFKKGSILNEAGLKSKLTPSTPNSFIDKNTSIPKKLPKETRLQKLSTNRAATGEQGTGSTLVPVPPANESEVSE